VLEAYDWSVERIVMEDGSHGVLCYFYDLSERVRNERAQKEQQHRLSIAYNAAGMGAWDFDVTSGQVHGTPQLAALLGVPGFTGDFAGIWQRVVHPDDKDAVDAAFDLSLRSGAPYDVDYRIVTKDGAIRYLAAQGEVVRDGKGQPARIIGVNYDITDRKQTEIALRQSEGRIRMVIDSTLAFVGVLDPDGTLREVNRPALHFGGLTRADVIGMPFWETPWWMHSPAVSQICRTAVEAGRTGHTNRCDVIIRGKDDRLITIDFLLSPVFDVQGNVEMLVASGFDISAREEARARAQALMGEINHRTKNILTLVQVLARMTARGGSADFITRFEERVHALALAQDLLFASAADTVDLGALAKSQLGHFRDLMGDRICLSGPKLDLAPHAAQAIGMALHELATNAGKYGALSSAQGRIDVVWDVQTDGKFKICWIEQGGPPVVPPKARGFGSTVVEEMTRNTLDAKVHLDYAPGGVKWHLTCGVKALTSPR
jgi:PAS domain S-box-containing protein